MAESKDTTSDSSSDTGFSAREKAAIAAAAVGGGIVGGGPGAITGGTVAYGVVNARHNRDSSDEQSKD